MNHNYSWQLNWGWIEKKKEDIYIHLFQQQKKIFKLKSFFKKKLLNELSSNIIIVLENMPSEYETQFK